MYTHPLIELLKSFSKKEMMWFGKFLDSPYFNKRKRLIKLFLILKRFSPDFEAKNLAKSNIYKLLYGNIIYNDSTIRNLMSDLLQLAQQYLKQEGMEKKEIESSFYLTKELFERGQISLFKSQMLLNKNILDINNTIDSDYFYHMSKIETDSFYINLLNQKVLKKSFVITESQKLINGITCTLTYFILETIKHNDNLLKYSRSYNLKKTFRQFQNLLKYSISTN